MAIISDIQDDHEQQKPIQDQKPSAPLPFNSVLDPSKPLAFLEKAFEFVAKGSELFSNDQAEKEILGVVRAVKGRDAERRKKAAAEERGLVNGGKAEKRLKEEALEKAEAASKKVEPVKKAEAVSTKEGPSTEEKKEDDGKKNTREPNKANGLDFETHTWGQSLQEVTVTVPVPPGTKSRFIVCDIKKNSIKVGLKGQPPIIDGELFQSVKVDDCFWSLEDQKSVSILLTKHNQMEWWKYLVKGEPTIDTKKVEPETSKLSDLPPNPNIERVVASLPPGTAPEVFAERLRSIEERFNRVRKKMAECEAYLTGSGGRPGGSGPSGPPAKRPRLAPGEPASPAPFDPLSPSLYKSGKQRFREMVAEWVKTPEGRAFLRSSSSKPPGADLL